MYKHLKLVIFSLSLLVLGHLVSGNVWAANPTDIEITILQNDQGVPYGELETLINQAGTIVEVVGVVNLGEEEITFGLLNFNKVPNDQFYTRIQETLQNKFEKHNLDWDQKVVNSRVRFKKVEIQQEKNQLMSFTTYPNFTVFKTTPEERQDYIELAREIQQGQENNTPKFNSLSLSQESNTEEQPQLFYDLDWTEEVGGRAMHPYRERMALPWEESPIKGDRQDRLKLSYRFNRFSRESKPAKKDKNPYIPYSGLGGEIYNWLPIWMIGEVKEIKEGTIGGPPLRQAKLRFQWSKANLQNLVIDSNETFEAEVEFYNYGQGLAIPGEGAAYITNVTEWESNLPQAYLDTRFGDGFDAALLGVGTAHPDEIIPDYEYYIKIQGTPNKARDHGLWKISFQRGYWYDHSSLPNFGDAWFVFTEEYEATVKIKQYHKYNQKYWAPSRFVEVIRSDQLYRYKPFYRRLPNSATPVEFKFDQGEYEILSFRVDEGDEFEYTFTLNNLLNEHSNLRIELYDHDFKLIGNSVYKQKQFPLYVDPGDYYLIIKSEE